MLTRNNQPIKIGTAKQFQEMKSSIEEMDNQLTALNESAEALKQIFPDYCDVVDGLYKDNAEMCDLAKSATHRKAVFIKTCVDMIMFLKEREELTS